MPPFVKCGVCAAAISCLAHVAMADPAALVIGNENYERVPDVRRADEILRLNGALTGAGFILRATADAGADRMQGALVAFEADAAARDGAIVFLAGRFVHSATETYFLASDAQAQTLEAARREGIPLSTLTAILAATPGLGVLALGDGGAFDMEAPFLDGGVGPVMAPQGVTVLVGAPQDVQGALDGLIDGGAVLDAEALERNEVALSGFVPRSGRLDFAGGGVESPPPEPDPRDAEITFWDAVRGIDTTDAYESYLDRYPGGIYAAEARERLAAIEDAPRREAEATEAALRLTRDQRREIQRALTLLDFNTRGIDGIFGPGTRAAISGFQSREGYEATGYLTTEQIRRLDRLARARAEALEEEARREAERAAREDREFWRDTGASGRETDLQRYLDRYPNGIFAEEARSELRAIEEIRRPNATSVERLTWQRVEENGSEDAYREYLRRYPDGVYAEAARREIARLEEDARGGIDRQAAARGEQAMNLSQGTLRTVEQRLDALDYDPGPVDGRFDDQTRNALLRYQQDRRLPATGYMNDATMVRILADTVISIFD